jgi:hypothetical protein
MCVIQGLHSGGPTDQGLAFRNINSMRLKRLTGRSPGSAPLLLVVDGQQRLTTTSLLLAATWHLGRRLALQAGLAIKNPPKKPQKNHLKKPIKMFFFVVFYFYF